MTPKFTVTIDLLFDEDGSIDMKMNTAQENITSGVQVAMALFFKQAIVSQVQTMGNLAVDYGSVVQELLETRDEE